MLNAIPYYHVYNCAQVRGFYNPWKYPVSESIPDNNVHISRMHYLTTPATVNHLVITSTIYLKSKLDKM